MREGSPPPRFCSWLKGSWLNGVAALSEVDLLPGDGAAQAEETPQVADDALVEGVLVGPAVLQVGDAVTGHELPGGGVAGHQVEVGAEQQDDHHGEHGHQTEGSQQEAVLLQPEIPGRGVREPRPARSTTTQKKKTNKESTVNSFWF